MGGSIDMNAGVFWETVGFLKSGFASFPRM